ncbi:MAG: chemotaxis protein CheW [Pseudanabaenaceae cyanobacterium bins.39]|nr:chemotaxis protein CheW [Pseudanabaenaceae cyanobacterium bins.39]
MLHISERDAPRLIQDNNLKNSTNNPNNSCLNCLKFTIDAQTIGLIESNFIQEVMTVTASHILPVPNKPSCILGLLSRRRLVYWGIDLAMLMGLQPLDQSAELYEVIFASFQDLALAIIVSHVSGLIQIPKEQINYDISQMPSTLRPYLKGSVLDNNLDNRIMYFLNAENILHSTILHS